MEDYTTDHPVARHYVRCSSCGEEHMADEITADNIEEDVQGRDLLSYRCPATGVGVKAYPIFGYR